MPIAISEEEFLVPSQSSDKKYKVTNISEGIVNVLIFKTDMRIVSIFMPLSSGLS